MKKLQGNTEQEQKKHKSTKALSHATHGNQISFLEGEQSPRKYRAVAKKQKSMKVAPHSIQTYFLLLQIKSNI